MTLATTNMTVFSFRNAFNMVSFNRQRRLAFASFLFINPWSQFKLSAVFNRLNCAEEPFSSFFVEKLI